jgi:hypothetical protein
MVLTIDGIIKLKGHLFCGREISAVRAEKHFGTHHYTFNFPSVDDSKKHLCCWENPIAIHLVREPKNEMYELYWMGLHGVTCQYLYKRDIENFSTFYSYFEKVIRLGKTYWDESKTYRN